MINTVNGTLTIEAVLGIIGDASELVTIQPNPVNGVFQLSLNGQQASHFALVDLQGKVVKRFPQGKQEYDISDLPKGLYLLILEGNNGRQLAGKVIKN